MQTPFRFLMIGSITIFLGGSLSAQAGSQFRPALLAPGPRSLVNLINAESLMKRGQENGLVMFQCGVSQLGRAYSAITFRGTENTQALSKEFLDQIDRAEFLPAKRDNKPQSVLLHGTLMYAVIDGKPRIRIFLNQEEADLKQGNDFVAPQLILDYGTKLKRIVWPGRAGSNNGTVAMDYSISATGDITKLRTSYEEPKGLGFASEVIRGTREAPFIPAFRNGRPATCTFTLPFLFKSRIGPNWTTG